MSVYQALQKENLQITSYRVIVLSYRDWRISQKFSKIKSTSILFQYMILKELIPKNDCFGGK